MPMTVVSRTLRATAAIAACALAVTAMRVAAQDAAAPALPQSPQQPSPSQPQLPVFRGEVDLIRLDVSVLDRDRRPITGLTAADFTIIEDDVPQTIGAFTEIIVAERDPKPTAWMRHAGVDISTNDFLDQLGEGRPYAIVMDDWNIPADDLFLVHNARAAGREIVSRLGPSDVAAVIFVHEAGRTVDFTTDRVKLVDAVNGFQGREPDWLRDEFEQREPGPRRGPPNPLIPRNPTAPWSPGGFGGATGGADLPIRSSRILGRSDCERRKPLVSALETAARRLAMVPNRRKTVALVSIGMVLDPLSLCDNVLRIQLNQAFGVAAQANINFYTVDVSDDQRFAPSLEPDPRRLFLDDMAHYTGGLVVGADGESTDTSVARIFMEAGSYYLLGYQSTKGAPDGTFRRIEVRVNRSDTIVRARSGYFAPTENGERVHADMDRTGATLSSLWDSLITPVEQLAARPPSANSLALSGLYPATAVPLRLSAVALGPAGPPGTREMHVAVALSVRLPPSRGALTETLTLLRHVYDGKGRPGSPVVTRLELSVPPTGGDETRYDVLQHLTLPPGRHEMRLNARSGALGRDGSIFTTIDVPDVARAPVTLSGVVLGTSPPPDQLRTDPLADVVPIVPTSARSFGGSERIAAFFQVFQGGAEGAAPVTLRTMILDRRDQPVVDRTETMPADAFAEGRGVPREIDLPLGELGSGPFLLSISATRADGISTRREVRFSVR